MAHIPVQKQSASPPPQTNNDRENKEGGNGMNRSYGRAIQRALPLLLLISFGAAVAAYAIAEQIGPRHEVHYSYLISLSRRDEVEDFRFDGYYALQATESFARTLAQWVQTPEVIVAAYRQADMRVPTQDARRLSDAVTARQSAPQLVTVTVQEQSARRTARLAGGLRAVMQSRVDSYHDEGIPALRFRVVPTESWAATSDIASPVIAAAAFVFTLIVAVNIVLLRESVAGSDYS